MIGFGRPQPASAIGAWFLAALTGDARQRDRQWAVIEARDEAGEFFPGEFLVVRVVFEALVHRHLADPAGPAAVSAVAHDAVTRFGPSPSDLIAVSAVIRRALSQEAPNPRYLGFGEEITAMWVRVSLAIVHRHPTPAGAIRSLILGGERTAAAWKPRVALTPAAPGRHLGRRRPEG